MRLPINRGFPLLQPLGGAVELFRPPEDVDQLYRVTLAARATAPLDPAPSFERHLAEGWTADPRFVRERRGTFTGDSTFEPVTLPTFDTSAVPLFRDFPMRGSRHGLYVNRPTPYTGTTTFVPEWAILGHVEIDDIDARVATRALMNERPIPPFHLPFTRAEEGGGEVVVHQLVPGAVDLVTLRCIVPAGMTVGITFYDGTYRSGHPHGTTLRLFNEQSILGDMSTDENPDDVLVLDRHPMQGPGSIRAVVVEHQGTSGQSALLYGAVSR